MTTANSALSECRGADIAETARNLPRLTATVRSLTTKRVDRWSALASIGAFDLLVARIFEPHIDALTILSEALSSPCTGAEHNTWGVYAAEGAGLRLQAIASRRGSRPAHHTH